ncbi:MAG: aminotransferase class V-fold PLP-dependent enzyme [bacterium]|nr:aminotransferase class V-fold PLP-dependent enzyme [bacterium]
MNTPIYNKLKKYHASDRVPFAMPGHKNGRGLEPDLIDLDVTELDGTLNLRRSDDETVSSAQKLLANLYKSDESYIITCGSTAGIQAMLSSALRPGETVLVSSDCHMSVINTCALCGYMLRFIPAALDPESLIPCDDEDIETMLDNCPDVSAVLVTSPNYYGICRNIRRFSEACHKHGIPLLVDEAHGAHFIASDRLPQTALQCGADAAVNSAHKTLNALTGAAFLHVKSRLIDKRRLRAALEMFQTSSPSYPIAASADIARACLENGAAWNRLIDYCNDFRKRLSDLLMLRFVENEDPTRIVINFSIFETSGFEIYDILSNKFGIDAEMADSVNVVFIASPSNTRTDFERLYDALNSISAGLTLRKEPHKVLPPSARERYVDPQSAFYSDTEYLRMTDSIDCICAQTITAYPPGIPVLCAGERITPSHILYLRHLKNIGAVFTGFDGTKIPVTTKSY